MAPRSWLIALAAATLVAGCGSSHSKAGATKRVEHPATLELAGPGGADPLGTWAHEVESQSHGKIRLRPGPEVTAGPDAEQRIVAAVRSGRTPFAYVGARVFDLYGNHAFQALMAPMLIDSYALEQQVLSSPLVSQMLDSVKRLGVVGIAVLPGPLRRTLGVTRSFTVPSDFDGAVVGYAKSALTAEALRALGASPQTIRPGGDVRGFDGLESQLGTIFSNGYMLHARSITVAPALWPRPLVLIMNPRTFARLSANQQNVLRTALSHSFNEYTDALRQTETDAMHQLCRGHARFLEADPAQFRAAFASVYAQLQRDPRTASYIAQIEKMKQGTTPEPIPSCRQATTTAARNPTPIDGVWRTTRTPEQSHDTTPENYGTFIHVFDRGRYAFQQWSPHACTWSYGRYSLAGKRLRFVVISAGGTAPTGAGGKPGETITLLWNIYRGKLSLPNAPELHDAPVERTPYELLSKTPSSKYFVKRCPLPANWDR